MSEDKNNIADGAEVFPLCIRKTKTVLLLLSIGIACTALFTFIYLFLWVGRGFSKTVFPVLIILLGLWLIYQAVFAFPRFIILKPDSVTLKYMISEKTIGFPAENLVYFGLDKINNTEYLSFRIRGIKIKNLTAITIKEKETEYLLQELHERFSAYFDRTLE